MKDWGEGNKQQKNPGASLHQERRKNTLGQDKTAGYRRTGAGEKKDQKPLQPQRVEEAQPRTGANLGE